MNEKFTLPELEVNKFGNIVKKGTCRIVALVGKGIDCAFWGIPNTKSEDFALARLMAHSPDLYRALLKARVFVPLDSQECTEIDNLLREINPDFDKGPEVTDIKEFAEYVKNMRDWQIKHAEKPSDETQKYSRASEFLIDCLVAQILQEAQS